MSGSPREDRLDELLERWDELRRRGEDAPVERLCADCPELAAELARRIRAVGDLDRLLEPTVDGPPRAPGSDECREHGTPPIPNRRYELFDEIARGGMGAVLKARDADLGRELAVKVLLERHRDSPGLVRRFVEEAKIAGQLQHPGVVPVYELGTLADRRPFFAMKLVKGRTLADLLRERTGPGGELSRFLSIFEAICQTMAYAHARGVIHRDLKPSNVMVGGFGEVQVMDWGLAKLLPRREANATEILAPGPFTIIDTGGGEPAADGSNVGQVIGTPAYMAPEQARGEVDRLDERADVFALGAILCTILTDCPPWAGGGPGEVLRRAAAGVTADAFARLDACGADGELVALAKTCLAAEPGDRPRGAGVVAERLTAYLAGVQERLRAAERAQIEAQARAEESSRRAAVERSRRLRTTALAGSVVVILGLVAAGAILYQRQVDEEAARVAVSYDRAIQHRDAARDAWSDRQEVAGWDRAVESAEAAEGLVTSRLPSDLQRRTARLLADVHNEAAAARSDAELLARLTAVRASKGTPDSDAPEGYRHAFEGLGVAAEGDAPDPSSLAARIRAGRPGPIVVHLASFLDDWGLILRGIGRGGEANRLGALAHVLDPDAWRGQLRAALALPEWADRRAALARLADAPDVLAQPAATLALLAPALRSVGEAEAAVSLMQRARFRHRGEAWIHQELGLALRAVQPPRTEDSLRAFTAAATLQPELGFQLAKALHDTGRTREGVEVLQDVVGRQRDAACYYWLGLMQNVCGERGAAASFARSAELARRSVQLRPADPLARVHLGNALHSLGDATGAAAAYREAVRLRPDSAEMRVHLGNALRDAGDPTGAVAAYREGLKIEPGSARAHLHLGLALLGLGDAAGALAACREAVRLSPSSADAQGALGRALRDAGDLTGALAAYREAVRLSPDSVVHRISLGDALRDAGDLPGAVAEYREAITRSPGFGYACSQLGLALLGSGDPTGAVAACREGVRLTPDSADARGVLGIALRAVGDLPGAIGEFREAIRLKPDLADAHALLGAVLRDIGDTEAGVESCREAVRLRPDFALARCELGRALRGQGQYAEALAELRRGHELGSRPPGWARPSAEWVRQAERHAVLAERLPAVLRGDDRPTDPGERLEFAQIAAESGHHDAAFRLFADVLEAEPQRTNDPQTRLRYEAARSALLTELGRGEGGPQPDAATRSALRRRALDWLRAERATEAALLTGGTKAIRTRVRQVLHRWKLDPALGGVREAEALARLPSDERSAWQGFWAEVDDLLSSANTDSP